MSFALTFLFLLSGGLSDVFAQRKKENYECKGPGCNVKTHNHSYFKPRKNTQKMARKVNPLFSSHKRPGRKTFHSTNPSPSFFIRFSTKIFKHRDVSTVTLPSKVIRHRNLANKDRAIKYLSWKDFAAYQKPRPRFLGLRRSSYPTIRLKHRSVANACTPLLKLRHRELSAKCYPSPRFRHRDVASKCYPGKKLKHMDLSARCLARYRVKHKDLSANCMPRVRIRHRQTAYLCYKTSVRLKHQNFERKCYPLLAIYHKDFDQLRCNKFYIRHVPISQYKVPCDPNIQSVTTTTERVGKDVKYFFTFKTKDCDLMDRYAGVAQGGFIETSKGDAVVADYVVKPNVYHPTQLIVEMPKRRPRKRNGEPNMKTVRLTEEETKEIMIRALVVRGKFVWLVRMYPEERPNLDSLKELYLIEGIPPEDINEE